MAKGRMLLKSTSLSRKVNRLSVKHALFYAMAIPHLDDWGDIDNDPEVLKATVVPMRKQIGQKDIIEFIKIAQIPDEKKESLITEFSDCLHFNKFEEHQKISAEKRAKSRFQKIPKNPQGNLGEKNNPQKNPK